MGTTCHELLEHLPLCIRNYLCISHPCYPMSFSTGGTGLFWSPQPGSWQVVTLCWTDGWIEEHKRELWDSSCWQVAFWCSFSGPKGCLFPPLYPFSRLLHQLKVHNGTVCLSANRVSNGKCKASTLNASCGRLDAIPNEEKLLIFTEMDWSPLGRIIWLPFWVLVLIKLLHPGSARPLLDLADIS